MITEYDIKMAAYIVKAMKQPNLNVFFSWGGHNFKPITDGVSFAVNGFIHQGEVRVVYDHCEDLFIVRTLNADGTTKDERTGIYFDQLQEVIDRLVECDNEAVYEEQIKNDPICQMFMNAENIVLI